MRIDGSRFGWVLAVVFGLSAASVQGSMLRLAGDGSVEMRGEVAADDSTELTFVSTNSGEFGVLNEPMVDPLVSSRIFDIASDGTTGGFAKDNSSLVVVNHSTIVGVADAGDIFVNGSPVVAVNEFDDVAIGGNTSTNKPGMKKSSNSGYEAGRRAMATLFADVSYAGLPKVGSVGLIGLALAALMRRWQQSA